MCNRGRLQAEPETLFERFGATWAQGVVRPNKDPVELFPKGKAFVIREEDDRRVLDVMAWGVLPPGATRARTFATSGSHRGVRSPPNRSSGASSP